MPSNPRPLVDGRYELAKRIGIGGYSEVWLAHDQVLGRPVAVKLLHEAYARHPESLERFRAEARHAGSISHQNIARIYDYGDPDPDCPAQLAYLVMEYVDGPSLAERLRTGSPFDAVACLDVVAQTAAGLEAAHAAGLVHRDIKPANLLLSSTELSRAELSRTWVSRPGVVKITDFGISRAMGSAPVTSTGVIIGTPGYLAPERAAGAQATYLSDLYSLGVVAYECLAGGPPFGGTPFEVALAHLDRPFPALPESVPGEVTTLVGQLVAKDPAERPVSAGAVALRAAELRDRLRGEAGAGDMAGVGGLAGAGGMAGAGSMGRAGLAGSAAGAGVGQEGSGAAAGLDGGPPGAGLDGAPDATRTLRSVRGSRGWRLTVGAMAAVGLLALAVSGIASALTDGGDGRQAHHASPTAATKIDVDAASMVGQPVPVAVRQLRRDGLRVRVLWRFSERERPGLVLRVRPAGKRPARSLVTIVGAAIPRVHGDDHGDGHGHDKHGHGEGHGGDDGGDGGPGHGGNQGDDPGDD